jgi:hypothetical protein
VGLKLLSEIDSVEAASLLAVMFLFLFETSSFGRGLACEGEPRAEDDAVNNI